MVELSEINFKTAKITKEAIENVNKYISKYGPNTFTISQIGDFYEYYGLKRKSENIEEDDDDESQIFGTNIVNFAKIAGLVIVEKKSDISDSEGNEYSLKMAGFKTTQLKRYLQEFIKAGYTTVVIDQETSGPGANRSVTGIYSPGTYINIESVRDIEHLSNNVTCVWIENNGDTLTIGIGNVDTYTGKSLISEYKKENVNFSSTYDELERQISILRPSEMVIISDFESEKINQIIKFIRAECKIHNINLNTSSKVKKCEKQIYQKKILKHFFEFTNTSVFMSDFLDKSVATQAFCYLLNFINEHNVLISKNIEKPNFENENGKMLVANYSFRQLNIIKNENSTSRNSSIINALNLCVTPMGKRHFNETLLNPITSPNILNREYNIIEYCISLNSRREIVSLLSKMSDIKKILRLLILDKFSPQHAYLLWRILINTDSILEFLNQDQTLSEYFGSSNLNSSEFSELKNLLENSLNLSVCKTIKSTTELGTDIFNNEYNQKLYDLKKNQIDSMDRLNACKDYLNKLIGQEFVNIHQTNKMKTGLKITVKRSEILKEKIEELDNKIVKIKYFSNFSNKNEKFILDLDELNYIKQSQTNFYISSTTIDSFGTDTNDIKLEILEKVKSLFVKFKSKILIHKNLIDRINNYLTILDFILCKAEIAIRFNYKKPIIQDIGKSYFKFKGLRHNLIELINLDSFYIPNDVEISENGILIYGPNNAGKSSLIKAVGINLILAQSGFYGAFDEMIFYPYDHIFTRIVSTDNIHGGMGTFFVEMVELRNILKIANSKSLVLGDELCSGTEINSAKSIIIGCLQHFSNHKISYMLATHLHDIVTLDEIVAITELVIAHMSAFYDVSSKSVKYTRKLVKGAGSNVYGLETLKSLDFPDDFLNRVMALRNKYSPLSISYLDEESSKYNSQKLRGNCESCKKKKSTEIHHIYKQKDADSNGFIRTNDGQIIHKNHPANLMAVCNQCHLKFHNDRLE